MAGGGRRGSYGNTAMWSMRPNAARSLWQYCHNAPEAPARHPRLELSTTVDRFRNSRKNPNLEFHDTADTALATLRMTGGLKEDQQLDWSPPCTFQPIHADRQQTAHSHGRIQDARALSLAVSPQPADHSRLSTAGLQTAGSAALSGPLSPGWSERLRQGDIVRRGMARRRDGAVADRERPDRAVDRRRDLQHGRASRRRVRAEQGAGQGRRPGRSVWPDDRRGDQAAGRPQVQDAAQRRQHGLGWLVARRSADDAPRAQVSDCIQ